MPRAYRPELMTNYSPVFRGVPTLPLEVTADGGELVCIKTNPEMIPYLVTAWELFRYDYFLRGTQDDIAHTHRELMTLLSQIMTAEPCEDCPDCPPTGGGGGGGGGVQLPDCIEIVQAGNEIVINIREDKDCMVTINVYESGGCGCSGSCTCGGNGGISGGGSFGGGSSSGGGASGSWIEEPDKPNQIATSTIPSNCDIITGGFVDYILDQQKEFFQQWLNAGGALETIIDGGFSVPGVGTITGDGVDWLTSFTTETMQNTIDIWVDSDFRLAVKTAFVKAFPSKQSWSSITRQQLLAVAPYIPKIIWAGVLPYGTRDIWAGVSRMMNINKLNSHLLRFVGECEQGDMTWLYANAGISYTPPTDVSALPPQIPFDYEWALDYDFTIGQQSWQPLFLSSYVEGVGYRHGTGSGAKTLVISHDGALSTTITGYRFYLTTPMIAGDLNQAILRIPSGTIFQTDNDVTESPATIELATPAVLSGQGLQITLQEDSVAAFQAGDLYRLILFGTGTPPSDLGVEWDGQS